MQAISSEPPSTWTETLAGVIIFIQFPLIYYLGFSLFPVAYGPGVTNGLQDLAKVILFLSPWFLIPLSGFAIGWMRGFPRWVYPYVVFSILISLYLMAASTPGISLLGFQLFGRELWGIRACMPGLLMVAIVLALTRSPHSLLVFFENGWNDWTRYVFALFGMMPLVNVISFDEIRDSYEIPFQIGLIVLMSFSAVAYLRSTSSTGRALSLLAGVGLCVLIDTIAPILYWVESGGVNIALALIQGVILMFIIFLPVLIGYYQRSNRQEDRASS